MSLRRALTGEQERCLGALMIVLAAVIAALSILFGACHGGYEQRAPDSAREQEVVVNAAIRAWEARFGSTIECHREHLTLGWASADDRAFDALCVGEQGWDGCTIVRQDGSSTIVLRDALFEQSYLDWLRAHEVTHFLEHCSGRVASGDPDHADDAVWDEQVDETLEALP
ncbi:MAG TPA: hypothetical protein VHM19_23380 [Polyangiales bacterium]|nr:hypothetical protein [Polyangiales bacterium]